MVGNVMVKYDLFLTSMFELLRPQKIMKFIHGGHFDFQWNLKKNHLHISISWEMCL